VTGASVHAIFKPQLLFFTYTWNVDIKHNLYLSSSSKQSSSKPIASFVNIQHHCSYILPLDTHTNTLSHRHNMSLKRKASFSSEVLHGRSFDTQPIADVPHHLNSRTRKRFRDNRPDQQTVYGESKLLSTTGNGTKLTLNQQTH